MKENLKLIALRVLIIFQIALKLQVFLNLIFVECNVEYHVRQECS